MSLIFGSSVIKYREATGALFIHAKSVKSVKTACVCIVFFFHYFKYYGKNNDALFNKVERKE